MKKVLSTVLSAVLITALAACSAPATGTTAAGTTAAGTTAASTDPIKIGGLAPLTGQVSVYGIAASNGAKMA
ncbi:MAG: amino acid ABC transporter substrate-binding protein, partial [Clostridiaceae bacterium]